eukprot:684850-Rhodomonas_salina.1
MSMRARAMSMRARAAMARETARDPDAATAVQADRVDRVKPTDQATRARVQTTKATATHPRHPAATAREPERRMA